MKRITVALECSHFATYEAETVPAEGQWIKKHFVCQSCGGGHFAALRVTNVEEIKPPQTATTFIAKTPISVEVPVAVKTA